MWSKFISSVVIHVKTQANFLLVSLGQTQTMSYFLCSEPSRLTENTYILHLPFPPVISVKLNNLHILHAHIAKNESIVCKKAYKKIHMSDH